jgi:hypothetical protein
MQIAKPVFEQQLSIMKRILKLGEFKFGKDSEQFKFFKEEVMNSIYEGTKKMFLLLSNDGVLEKCGCGANLRHGWTDCQLCAGSGFKDKIDKK